MNTVEYRRAIVSNYREYQKRLGAKNNGDSCKEWTPVPQQPARYSGLIVNVIEVVGGSALVGRKDVKCIVPVNELERF